MNTLTAAQVRTKIRKIIGMPNSGKNYFNQHEMLKIIKIVNPKWTRQPKLDEAGMQMRTHSNQLMWKTDHNRILPEGVPSWIQQRVVGTHPSLANLKNILSQLEEINGMKLAPLTQDIKAASRIIAEPEQLLNPNCDGESDLHNLAISTLSMDPGQDIDICYDSA